MFQRAASPSPLLSRQLVKDCPRDGGDIATATLFLPSRRPAIHHPPPLRAEVKEELNCYPALGLVVRGGGGGRGAGRHGAGTLGKLGERASLFRNPFLACIIYVRANARARRVTARERWKRARRFLFSYAPLGLWAPSRPRF